MIKVLRIMFAYIASQETFTEMQKNREKNDGMDWDTYKACMPRYH